MKVTRIGFGIAKSVFEIHGVDVRDETFFAQESCTRADARVTAD